MGIKSILHDYRDGVATEDETISDILKRDRLHRVFYLIIGVIIGVIIW